MTELSPELAKLVLIGRAASRPSADTRERIRAALALHLAAPTPFQRTAARSSPPIGPWAALRTKVGALAATGALAALSYAAWSPPHPPQEAESSKPIGAALAPKNPPLPPPTLTTAPRVIDAAATAPPVTRPVTPPSAARAKDRLSEELRLVSRAERALYGGNPALALSTLRDHERRFPRGALSEERVATTIHALCALGRTGEAAMLLAKLAPNSLHESNARDACRAFK